MKHRRGAKTGSDGPPARLILRVVAAFVAGVFVGSLVLGSASAHLPSTFSERHLGRHAWLGFVKERSFDKFFRKQQANRRFLRKNEQAADADKLDGKDSTAFQEKCRQGAVHGGATVSPPSLTSTYTDLTEGFSCHGVVRAKRMSEGVVRVDLGHGGVLGFGSCSQRDLWQVTVRHDTSNDEDLIATVLTVEETVPDINRFDCVAEVRIYEVDADQLVNGRFYIALLN